MLYLKSIVDIANVSVSQTEIFYNIIFGRMEEVYVFPISFSLKEYIMYKKNSSEFKSDADYIKFAEEFHQYRLLLEYGLINCDRLAHILGVSVMVDKKFREWLYGTFPELKG